MFWLPSCAKVRFLSWKSHTGFFCHSKVLLQDGRWMLHPQNYPIINSIFFCQPLVQSCRQSYTRTIKPKIKGKLCSYYMTWGKLKGNSIFPKRYPIIIQVVLFDPHLLSTIKMMLYDWHHRREFRIIPTNFLEMHQLSLPHKYMFCNMKKVLSVNYLYLER